MAKHFIGFGLFSSIVGFFVLVSWAFSSSPVPTVEVFEAPTSVKPWTYCDKKRRPKSVDSPRAIADRNSGTITIYINELPGDSDLSSDEVSASFTFYAVRGDEVRLSDVVNDSLVRVVRRDAGTKWTLQYNAPWVRDLSFGDNLYVMAGAGGKTLFSIDSAMPVIIKN